MGSYPPLAPFRLEEDVAAIEWLDQRLHSWKPDSPPLVGSVVPSGFEAYARLLHPARRILDRAAEHVPLRWSEIAEARGKRIHPEV
jgi:hypothetical protein